MTYTAFIHDDHSDLHPRQLIICLFIVLVAHALAIYGISLLNTSGLAFSPPAVLKGALINLEQPKPAAEPLPEPPKPKPPKPKPEPVKENRPVVEKEPVKIPETVLAVDQTAAETTNTLAAEAAPPVEELPVTMPMVDAKSSDNKAPTYPRMARRLGQQGTVILDVYILADGTVGEVELKKTSGYPRLDEAAMAAVKRWKYIPAKQGGKAIDYWYTQPVKFVLD